MAPRDPRFWDVASSVEVVPSTSPDTAPHVLVTWDSSAVEVHAIVDRVARFLAVRQFSVITRTGQIPPYARRLPSDGTVVQAIRASGTSGPAAIAWLLDEHHRVSEMAADLDGAVSTTGAPAEDQVDVDWHSILKEYGKEVSRRPRERVSGQVREVRSLRQQGRSTTEIVDLLKAQGVSERTAYRRLAQADLEPGKEVHP